MVQRILWLFSELTCNLKIRVLFNFGISLVCLRARSRLPLLAVLGVPKLRQERKGALEKFASPGALL